MAHDCHGKTKNLTAKTKTSRQNQKPHGKNKIPHGKTKNLTAKPNNSQQKQNSPGFAVSICFCREVFGFCCEVFGFAVRFLVLSWGVLFLPWGFRFCREVFCFCCEVFGFAVTVVGHRIYEIKTKIFWLKGWRVFCVEKYNSAPSYLRHSRKLAKYGNLFKYLAHREHWHGTWIRYLL